MRYFDLDMMVAGVDEAGRGCLAGPVVASAVILDPDRPIEGLNDSKKLSENKRMELREEIMERSISWAVGWAGSEEIDEINILQATYLAMHRAIDSLSREAELILVDGNRFKPFKDKPFRCEVKGDGRFYSIAAASILAKTERDLYMHKIHLEYPQFDWCKNKGYPTDSHRKALQELGPTEYHRQSFKVKPVQLKIF
jgi:ribonuclease HII